MDKDKIIIRRLKLRLTAAFVVLLVIVVVGVFMLSGLSVNQIVLAITGSYNKQTNDQLTSADWNNLPVDFVASDDIGSLVDARISSALSVGGSITTQINTAVAAADSGGGTFVHWGNQTCPNGTELLYRGFGFGPYYNDSHEGSGAKAVCLQLPGDAGATPGVIVDGGDLIYPIGTGSGTFSFPPGIPERKEIKCAVCFNPRGVCYERWYGDDCPGSSDFVPVYTGYGMGGWYNAHGDSDRHCVDNVNFDDSVENSSWGQIWYVTGVWDNADLGLYTVNSGLKCSICCKQ